MPELKRVMKTVDFFYDLKCRFARSNKKKILPNTRLRERRERKDREERKREREREKERDEIKRERKREMRERRERDTIALSHFHILRH